MLKPMIVVECHDIIDKEVDTFVYFTYQILGGFYKKENMYPHLMKDTFVYFTYQILGVYIKEKRMYPAFITPAAVIYMQVPWKKKLQTYLHPHPLHGTQHWLIRTSSRR